jgi:hypothetical protein
MERVTRTSYAETPPSQLNSHLSMAEAASQASQGTPARLAACRTCSIAATRREGQQVGAEAAVTPELEDGAWAEAPSPLGGVRGGGTAWSVAAGESASREAESLAAQCCCPPEWDGL